MPVEPRSHLLRFQTMLKATKRPGRGDVPFGGIVVALAVAEEILDDRIFRTGVVRITSRKTGVAFVAEEHQPCRGSVHQSANGRPPGVRVQPDFAEMCV